MKISVFLLVCAAVFACTLAADADPYTFQPDELPCKTIISYHYEEDDMEYHVVDYIMHSSDDVFYTFEVGYNASDLSQKLYYGVRCSERKAPDEYMVWAIYQYVGGNCTDDEEEYGFDGHKPFKYKDGPEVCECPDGKSSTCRKYTNSKGEYIIVNDKNQYVYYDEVNITYEENMKFIDVSEYEMTCGNSSVDNPGDICVAKTFTPADLPCKLVISYGYTDDELGEMVVYDHILHTSNTVFYIYEAGYNASKMEQLVYHGTRSYERPGKEEGKVSAIYHYTSGECDESEENGFTLYKPFVYETGPDVIICPDGKSDDCKSYGNSTGYTIIVDKQGRYVKNQDGFVISYPNVPFASMSDFAVECNNDTIAAPKDICAEKRSFLPRELPCKYHLSYNWTDEMDNKLIVHEYGLHTNNTIFYLYEVGYNASDLKQVIYHGTHSYERKAEEEGMYVSVYSYTNGTCQDEEEDGYTVYDPFEYETGPNDVECPDGKSTGCKRYTNSSGYSVIVNSEDRYVKDPDGYIFDYYNDFVPLSDFNVKCNDQSFINVSEDICAVPRNFTPADLPCRYHLTYPWVDEMGRDLIVHEYGMHTSDTVFYLYEVGYLASDGTTEIYHGTRSHERKAKDAQGNVIEGRYMSLYVYENGTCQEEEEGGYTVYDAFDYETGPNDVDCPDGKSTGCKKYTNSSGYEVIVDADNHYVVDPDEWELTFINDGKFVPLGNYTIKCEAINVFINAPADICNPAPPQSGSASCISVSVVLMVLAAIALLL